MDGVLHRKFSVNATFKFAQRYEVEKYLSEHIGPRTYYLHSEVGGKQWRIKKNYNEKIVVEMNDPEMLTLMCLQFS